MVRPSTSVSQPRANAKVMGVFNLDKFKKPVESSAQEDAGGASGASVGLDKEEPKTSDAAQAVLDQANGSKTTGKDEVVVMSEGRGQRGRKTVALSGSLSSIYTKAVPPLEM